MEISLNTPALLFPAITLLMLAYTNRFLALATLIRNLHTRYQNAPGERPLLADQIQNLRRRLTMIKYMQAAGVLSFLLCVLSMLLFFLNRSLAGTALFGLSLVSLLASLGLSLYEIQISTRALEIELRDME